MCLFISGRTFPVEQFFLEDVMEITNYVLEENGPYARKIKKGDLVYLLLIQLINSITLNKVLERGNNYLIILLL